MGNEKTSRAAPYTYKCRQMDPVIWNGKWEREIDLMRKTHSTLTDQNTHTSLSAHTCIAVEWKVYQPSMCSGSHGPFSSHSHSIWLSVLRLAVQPYSRPVLSPLPASCMQEAAAAPLHVSSTHDRLTLRGSIKMKRSFPSNIIINIIIIAFLLPALEAVAARLVYVPEYLVQYNF